MFTALIVFMFEVKSIKSVNLTQEYLHTQAQLHLDFLKHYAKTLNDDSIKTLQLQEETFHLKIEVLEKSIELYVQSNQYPIRLHESLIK